MFQCRGAGSSTQASKQLTVKYLPLKENETRISHIFKQHIVLQLVILRWISKDKNSIKKHDSHHMKWVASSLKNQLTFKKSTLWMSGKGPLSIPSVWPDIHYIGNPAKESNTHHFFFYHVTSFLLKNWTVQEILTFNFNHIYVIL